MNWLAKTPFLILCLSGGLMAQTATVEGDISASGSPIIGATVHIPGTDIGTATDPEGHYVLDGIPPGQVTLEFRSIGYETTKSQLILLPGGKTILPITLKENGLGLDEIVITGTLEPTYLKASPIRVEVITSRHLNTYLPPAASSLVEGIQLVNGIQEVVACGVCFTNSISINGLPGPYTAILMDGSPIYGNLASVYGLNGIPSMIIDRFEVIKGPNSTLYGSEAVAGVINIITKSPDQQPLVSIDVMGTSHLESFGNLAVAPKVGQSDMMLGVNYAYINDFDDRNGDGFGDMINLDRVSIFNKWTFYRPSGKDFSVAAKYYYEDRRNGVQEFLDHRNYQNMRGNDSIYGESIYTNRLEVFGSYQLPAVENLKLDYSFSLHDQDSYYGSDHYLAQQKVAFANFIWNKPLKAHILQTGLTARYQHYDDNTFATQDSIAGELSNRPDNQYIPGVFVQDEWSVSPKTTLMGGARMDHYNAHGLIFSPRLNLKYKIGQWTTFRTNLGTGFRVVNLFTEDHAFITGQRQVVIEGQLEPEESYSGSLNLNHVFSLGNSQGSLDLDAHYTYFTNKIIPNYDDPLRIVYSNSDGFAVTKGIGLTLNQELAIPLAFNLGFAYQQVTQTEPDANNRSITSEIEFAPRYSGILTANYGFERAKISLAYTWRLTGPMALPRVFDLDSNGEPESVPRPTLSSPFSIHNLQANKAFSSSWSVYMGVQNIFDYIQPISPLVGYNDPNSSVGFGKYFDTAYAYSPIHGREFYLGISWNLGKD